MTVRVFGPPDERCTAVEPAGPTVRQATRKSPTRQLYLPRETALPPPHAVEACPVSPDQEILSALFRPRRVREKTSEAVEGVGDE